MVDERRRFYKTPYFSEFLKIFTYKKYEKITHKLNDFKIKKKVFS